MSEQEGSVQSEEGRTHSPVDEEGRSSGRLILLSLVISYSATMPAGILMSLLLIDIALTFGVSVGVMGQLGTVSSTVAVIACLIVGALSIRFKHKSLLMVGLMFIGASALGCGLASSFDEMLVVYSLSGLGAAMIGPMAETLVAEHFPVEKRTSAIGWLYAGSSLSYVIGAPIIGFIAGSGGWRLAFLASVLPISLLSLFLAVIGLPSKSHSIQPTASKLSYLDGFKEVITNRSASACVAGWVFLNAGFMAIFVYNSSFFRQQFLVSTDLMSLLFLGLVLCYVLGSLVSGHLVKRFGRKPLTVLTAFLSGIFVTFYTILPNLWLSLMTMYLGCLFTGIATAAISSLALEQVPRYRGTMMSINYAAANVGSALGAGFGGLVLLLFDYAFMGMFVGIMYIIAAMIYHLLVIDPTASAVTLPNIESTPDQSLRGGEK